MSQRYFPVPVLQYHRIIPSSQWRSDRVLGTHVDDFRRQMRLLALLGYRTRCFREVVEAVSRRLTLPRRTVAITFDDGYCCAEDTALPILAPLRFTATVFVVSGCVGTVNTWDAPLDYPAIPLMDWQSLRRLEGLGWEIGGHTRSHPRLGGMDAAAAYEEILSCKYEIEGRLRTSVSTFCYPYGDYDARTPSLVRSAGYLGACTTRSSVAGGQKEPFLLPRVKTCDGPVGLLYRILLRPALPTFRKSAGIGKT